VRSFETAVAHYPSTSVATHTATRRTTTHLRCVTKKRTDAPPLRHEDHEDHEETIVSNEGTIVTDDVGRNGVPHLDGTTRRRTSVASRQNDKRRSAPRRNSTTTHLRCVTKTRNETTHLRCVTKRSVRTYKRNGVCTSIATPRTRTPGS